MFLVLYIILDEGVREGGNSATNKFLISGCPMGIIFSRKDEAIAVTAQFTNIMVLKIILKVDNLQNW